MTAQSDTKTYDGTTRSTGIPTVTEDRSKVLVISVLQVDCQFDRVAVEGLTPINPSAPRFCSTESACKLTTAIYTVQDQMVLKWMILNAFEFGGPLLSSN